MIYHFAIRAAKRYLISALYATSGQQAGFSGLKWVPNLKLTPLHAYSLIKLIRQRSIVTVLNPGDLLPFTSPLHEKYLRKQAFIGSVWPGALAPDIHIGLQMHIANLSVNVDQVRPLSDSGQAKQVPKN